MKYKITITKVEDVLTNKEGQWTLIDKRPWTEKEFEDSRARAYGDFKDFLEKNPLKDVLGYAPSRVVSEQVETKVLEQTIETLDLAAVIKAVNGL